LPEFNETQIPEVERNANVHHELHALLAQRNAIEQDLSNMYSHVTADGTRLDPDRDSFEDEHQGHLSRLDSTHREMYSAYARFLDTSPPRMGPYSLLAEGPPAAGS
jgi:hypothetical protein